MIAFTGGTIITMDGKVFSPGTILVDGPVIHSVGEELEIPRQQDHRCYRALYYAGFN